MADHFKRRMINGGNRSNCLFIYVFSIVIEWLYFVENLKYIGIIKLTFYGKSIANDILFLLVQGRPRNLPSSRGLFYTLRHQVDAQHLKSKILFTL
jgi:hypothetical protein